MLPKFEHFIRERLYLHNVTSATISWYTEAFKWLPSESPSLDELKGMVVRMREKGLKATGANSVIRAVNSYLHWCQAPNIKCSPVCTHLRLSQLKEPQLVLPTYTPAQITRFLNFKPRTFYDRRTHLLVLFFLDTGCRKSEATGLRIRDIDLDNLLVTLDGKGRKQRIVPISFEMRKALFRYITMYNRKPDSLLFGSKQETRVEKRNVLRSVKLLCKRLGFDPPARTVHAFRHTFAVNYLRRGGSVFHLQKVLGHSTLEMTRRYANLVTADLQAIHERVSLLSCSG